jgi:hypothetical protein
VTYNSTLCAIEFNRVIIDFETGLTKTITADLVDLVDLNCISEWVDLGDTVSFIGTPGQHVVVNSAGILSFEDPPSFSDLVGASAWVDLVDTVSVIGSPGQHVVVNGAGILSFEDPPSFVFPSFGTSGFTGTEEVVTDWLISDTDIILKKANVTMEDGLVKNWVALSDEIIPGSTCSCPSDQVGASTFLELTDTPSTYTGEGGKYVVVNSAEDGLIFIDLPSFPSDQVGASAWTQLTDTVGAIGTPGQHVVVNSAGILSFEDPPSFSDTIYGVISHGGLAKINNSFCIDFDNMDSLLSPTQSWEFIGHKPNLSTKPVYKTTLEAMNQAMTFINLDDTPVAYFSDDAGKYVVVNSAADGLIFIDLPSDQAGASTWVQLTDTVSAIGTPGQHVVVNSAGILSFEDPPSFPSVTPFPSSGITSAEDVLISWVVNDSGNIVTTKRLFTYTDGLLTDIGAPVTAIISTEDCSCPSDQVGASTFLELTDTPGSYAGEGGKYVVVNSAENALIFIDLPSAASVISYSTIVDGGLRKDNNNDFGLDFDNAGTVSPVLTDEVFHGTGTTVNANTLSDINAIMEFIRQADTPAAYAGEAGKLVAVNGAENAVEFIDASDAIAGLIPIISGFTGNKDVVTDWYVSGTTVVLERANISVLDGLVKNIVDISALLISAEECSCPSDQVGASTFLELTDTPSAYGAPGQYVTINSAGDGLIFTDLPSFSDLVGASTWVQLNDTVSAIGSPGQHVVVNSAGILSFEDPPSFSDLVGASTFLELTDTPSVYGTAGQHVVINSTADGLIFVDLPSDQVGASTWVQLNDTVSAIGSPGQHVVVNSAGILSFEDPPSFSDLVGASTFLELTDTPASYTGQAGKVVVVNSAEDGLIFSDIIIPSFTTSGHTGNEVVVTDWTISGTDIILKRAGVDMVDGLVKSWALLSDIVIQGSTCSCPSDQVGASTFLELTDTPSTYGTPGQYVTINSAGDGLIFTDLPSDSDIIYGVIDDGGLAKLNNSFCIDFNNMDSLLTPTLSWQFIGYNPDLSTKPVRKTTLEEINNAMEFIKLTDTPVAYFSDDAGKHVVVNSTADGLIFVDLPSDQIGPSTFLELTDTPATYSGEAGKYVIVNSTEDALIFVDLPSDQIGPTSWIDLNDTDSALGTPGQRVVVDPTGQFLTFEDIPSITPFPSGGLTSDTDVLISWTVNGSGNIVTTTQLHTYTDGLLTAKAAPVTTIISTEECSCPSDQVGASTFLELTDTPGAYGTAGQYVIINSTADGLIFTDLPTDSDLLYSTTVDLGLIKDSANNFGIDFDNMTATSTLNLMDWVITNQGGPEVQRTGLAEVNAIFRFILQEDTPSTYVGQAGKYIRVNSTPNGLEFVDPPTENSVVVNDGLYKDNSNDFGMDFDNTENTAPVLTDEIFHGTGTTVNANTLSDINAIMEFIRLTDTPAAYAGEANKLVAVNGGATALEFIDASTAVGGLIPIISGFTGNKDVVTDWYVSGTTVVLERANISVLDGLVKNIVDISALMISAEECSCPSDQVGASTFLELTDTPSTYGNAGQYVTINSAGDGLIFTDLPSDQVGASTWVQLNDTVSAIGNPGQHVVVNSAGILSFADLASDLVGASTFLQLTDTPGTYGTQGQYVVINSTADGLIFTDLPSATVYSTTVDLGLIKDSSNNFGIDFDNMTTTSTLDLMDFIITNENGPEVQKTSLADVNAVFEFILQADTPSTYVGQAGQYIRVNSTPNGLEFVDPPVDRSAWVQLTDTDSALGTIGQYVIVDPTGNFLTFTDLPSGAGGAPFPSNGLTSAEDVVISWAVNASGNVVTTRRLFTYTDGLLTAIGAPVTTTISTEECSCPSDQVGASTFLELTDTPGAYGTVGQYVVINSTADGLIFIDLPTDSDLTYSTTVDLGLIKDSSNNFGIDFDNMTATSTLNLMDWVITNQGGPEVQRTGLAEVNAILRFILQEDTPSTYVGQAGKYIRVNSTPNGLEFVDAPAENSVVVDDGLRKDGNDDFGLDFDNTENTAPVLTDEVFHGTGTVVNANTLSDINAIMEFIRLTDTPAAYAGEANKLVAVNGAANALEFIDASTAVGGLIPIISGHTGNEVVVTDWTISGTDIILKRAGVDMVDGLVKSWALLSDIVIQGSTCSCPSDQVGASTFLELTDTPSVYGTQGQYVVINSTADGLVFIDLPSDQVGAVSWVDLNDTDSALGTAGQIVVVDSTGTFLTFADLASDLVGASTFLELTDTPSVYGTQGQYVTINSTADGLIFTDLPSTTPFPDSGITSAEDVVISWAVNGSGNIVTTKRLFTYTDGLLTAMGAPVTTTISTEECSCPSDQVGASTFLELTDTPGAYGTAGQYVVINSAADGLIFTDIPSAVAYSVEVDGGLKLDSANNFGFDFGNMIATPSSLNLTDGMITAAGTGSKPAFTGLAEVNQIFQFILQEDTPSTYTGQAGKYLRVNSTPNGLEFVDAPDYSVIVNDGLRKDGNDDFGMDFNNTENTAPTLTDEIFHGLGTTVNANTLADINAIMEFIRLTDTPAAYAGEAGKIVAVNGAANALEFITKSDVVNGGGGGGVVTTWVGLTDTVNTLGNLGQHVVVASDSGGKYLSFIDEPTFTTSGHTGNEVVVTDWTVSGTDIILKRAGVDMVDGLVKSWALLSDIIIAGSTCSCPVGSAGGAGLSTFLELTDTPSAYGNSGQYVIINSTADGLIFTDLPTYSTVVNGGIRIDGNNDFGMNFDNAGNVAPVLADEVFHGTGTTVNTNTLADINAIMEFIRLTDTPNAYAGEAGKLVAVNGAANAVEFIDASTAVGGLVGTIIPIVSGFTGTEDFVKSWWVSGNTIVLAKATVSVDDGLVKNITDIANVVFGAESCSCPCPESCAVNSDAFSVIADGGLERVGTNFGMNMTNTASGNPGSTAKLYFENGGDAAPQQTTLAALLGAAGGVASAVFNIIDDITWNGSTGELKKIRRTGVIIQNGIVTDEGTLSSAILFTASACPSA